MWSKEVNRYANPLEGIGEEDMMALSVSTKTFGIITPATGTEIIRTPG